MPTQEQTGREQRRNSAEGRVRLPNLARIYRRELEALEPGEFEFRVFVIRPGQKVDRIDLTDLTEALDWSDAGPVLTGSATFRRPDPDDVRAVPIGRGHRVRLQVRRAGGWYRLWDQRVISPPVVDGSGIISATLEDDLSVLQINLREWDFRKTKARKKGWKAHEITSRVCSQEGVRVGRLARGTVWIEKLDFEGSGLEAIKRAYKEESDKTGVKYIIRLRDGKLDVVPFERSKILYEIRGIEEYWSQDAVAKKQRPRTVLRAKGRLQRGGGDSEKIEIEVAPEKLVARYGYAVLEKDYGRVKSHGELRDKARRDLARELEVKRTATLSIPGIPFLERGSTLHWRTREPGWIGETRHSRDRSYCYARTVSHSLSSNRFTTELTVSQVDPYLQDQRRLDREAREERRRDRRGRDRDREDERSAEEEEEG